ncbi:MAG: hypothetical protein ABH883_01590 [Candidatus Omnitrophota bacterium]
MERSTGVSIYGTAVMVYGAYNLLGTGGYKHFSGMFQPLPAFIIFCLYLFTVIYGICGIYCGVRILRLENWARKVMVIFTAISVISGFFLNRTVMNNFKTLLVSGKTEIPLEMAGTAYNYILVFTALIALFELSIIYFFTRVDIKKQFAG